MSKIRLASFRLALALVAVGLTARTAAAEKEGGMCWHYHDVCNGSTVYHNCPWTEVGGWVLNGVAALQCTA
jgi:hypothetical protein